MNFKFGGILLDASFRLISLPHEAAVPGSVWRVHVGGLTLWLATMPPVPRGRRRWRVEMIRGTNAISEHIAVHELAVTPVGDIGLWSPYLHMYICAIEKWSQCSAFEALF